MQIFQLLGSDVAIAIQVIANECDRMAAERRASGIPLASKTVQRLAGLAVGLGVEPI